MIIFFNESLNSVIFSLSEIKKTKTIIIITNRIGIKVMIEIFSDINNNLCIRLKSGALKFFNSEAELDKVLAELPK